MSLSDESRLAAINALLTRMLNGLGERGFDEIRFEVNAETFRDIPHTTWLELEGMGYVKAAHAVGSPGHQLTGGGWIAALKAAGTFEGQRDRAVRLRTALKDVVKGRPLEGAVTDLHELTAKTGLPMDWIWNALQSRLVQLMWPWDHLDIRLEHGGRVIRVPGRFGSRRLLYEAGPFPDP